MSYQLEIPRPVQKEIKELPGYVRAQAIELFDQLSENPRPPRSKELRDKLNIYRIWLAKRWRIAYQVDDDLKRIRILRIRLKEQIDYDSLEALD